MAETAFTSEQLKRFHKNLREAIQMADTAIYGTSRDLPGAWDAVSNAFEDLFTLGTLIETKERVLKSYQRVLDDWEARKKTLWTLASASQYEGQPIGPRISEYAFTTIQNTIDDAKRAIATVSSYAKGNILTSAIKNTFGKMAETLTAAGEAVASLSVGVFKTIAAVGNWLPWIIGGALLLPLLLRSFSAFKRGGAAAAADEAAGQIERGRAAAGRAVASGARAVVTRGMAGVRRRRRF